MCRVEVELTAVSALVTVALLDGNGRQLLVQRRDAVRQGAFLLPVPQLPAGGYQVWVVTEEGVAAKEWVKLKEMSEKRWEREGGGEDDDRMGQEMV